MDYIKNKYGNRVKLLFTDTDNFMHESETENVLVTILKKNKETVDFSKYSAESKYYDEANTLIVGKTAEEMGGFASKEFVRSKPKMYSILVSNSDEYKKARCVNKNVCC